MRDAITDVPGIKVGHWTDRRRATGCTVILAEAGAVPGYHCPGGAPEGIATDLLRPENMVPHVHAVLLTGGSAFGLEAAAGVRNALAARGVGLRFAPELPPIPIVTGAVLFDLRLGSPTARPTAEAGARAVARATRGAVAQGSVGAGAGATVGKAMGGERVIKGGLGTASLGHASGLVVGAIAAVNSFGDVIDPETGALVAGPRGRRRGEMLRTADLLRQKPLAQYVEDARLARAALQAVAEAAGQNTTLVAVATNARLTKAQATRLAIMASDGLSQAVRPARTPGDGDTVFALATGAHPADLDAAPGLMPLLGSMAAVAAGRAIVRGVEQATGLAGVPSVGEWRGRRRRR